ncbi:MAG: hypothetical protein EBV53_14490 [Proteobacteria bacterium]|nr:hypothetical protein [Pseudomonadota bacterium]
MIMNRSVSGQRDGKYVTDPTMIRSIGFWRIVTTIASPILRRKSVRNFASTIAPFSFAPIAFIRETSESGAKSSRHHPTRAISGGSTPRILTRLSHRISAVLSITSP